MSRRPATPPPVPPRPDRPSISIRISPDSTDREGKPTPSTRWDLHLWLEAPADLGGGSIDSKHFIDDQWTRGHGNFASFNAARRASKSEGRRLGRIGRRWMREKARENFGEAEWVFSA